MKQVLDVTLQKGFNERQSDKSEVDLFREIHSPQTVWAVTEGEYSLEMWCG